MICKYFSFILWIVFFTFLMVSFAGQNCLWSSIHLFYLLSLVILMSYLRNNCLNQGQKLYSYVFFSKCFIVPGLIIWSLVHFELIFTYLVDNLTFLFCKLPFVPHVFFSNQVFFPSYFKMLFALYFCHSCCRYFSYYIVQGWWEYQGSEISSEAPSKSHG